MLEEEVIVDEVSEFTKDMLKIYVKAPLYGDCSNMWLKWSFWSSISKMQGMRKGEHGEVCVTILEGGIAY